MSECGRSCQCIDCECATSADCPIDHLKAELAAAKGEVERLERWQQSGKAANERMRALCCLKCNDHTLADCAKCAAGRGEGK